MEIILELKKIVDPIQLFKKWLCEAEEKEIIVEEKKYEGLTSIILKVDF